jgi:hypothetical protein
MLSENDRGSGEGDNLHSGHVDPTSLPPAVVAQERDIEAMFKELVAGSRGLRKVRAQANAEWIGMVLLSLVSVLGVWLLYLKSE